MTPESTQLLDLYEFYQANYYAILKAQWSEDKLEDLQVRSMKLWVDIKAHIEELEVQASAVQGEQKPVVALKPMENEDGTLTQWYFDDTERFYIDVHREGGVYSVFLKNRVDGAESYSEHQTPSAPQPVAAQELKAVAWQYRGHGASWEPITEKEFYQKFIGSGEYRALAIIEEVKL